MLLLSFDENRCFKKKPILCMNANINCHFSQKGLGENFYFLGFLLTHIGYWAGVIVIPQVHFKSHLSTFQARCERVSPEARLVFCNLRTAANEMRFVFDLQLLKRCTLGGW